MQINIPTKHDVNPSTITILFSAFSSMLLIRILAKIIPNMFTENKIQYTTYPVEKAPKNITDDEPIKLNIAAKHSPDEMLIIKNL